METVGAGWTCYGLDGPGMVSWEGVWRDFSHTSCLTLYPTELLVQCVPGLSREQSGWGLVLTTHPLLAAR
jgi:hypothetical protein